MRQSRRMHFNVVNRRIHYWASFALAIPLLVIIGSGLLLQMKKQADWVQPPEKRGTGVVPAVSFQQILESVKGVPEMGVTGWDGVNRMDVRPDRGMVKVWLRNGYEVQVDLGTARVLQLAYRRSDLIESIHDGSFFAGDWTKLGLFAPAGLTLLLLWLSGLWMFAYTFFNKRKLAEKRNRMRSKAAVVAALLAGSPVMAQGPALDVLPVVGAWQPGMDGADRTIVFDPTREQPAIADGTFPVAAVRGVDRFTSGTLDVEFKLIAGKTDQTAGLVFNLKPNGDYHYVRFNTKDGNVALWKYVKGRQVIEHGTVHRQLPLGAWHRLRVQVDGRRITGEVVGTPLRVEAALDEAVDGRIGFWTKPDSHTAFKNLSVTPAK